MLLIICIAAVFLSGCTTQTPPAVVPVTTTVPPTATLTVAPVDAQACTSDADCIPAQCCHPSSCVRQTSRVCNAMCTQSCEGPLDCGAGSCGCTNGRCSVVPALTTTPSVVTKTSLTLTASPQRYSPIMSSTPGIGITVDANGFDKASSRFAWSSTYGDFFSWGAVNYTVNEVENPYTNDGGKLYWTFTQKPASTLEPVVITVTATDAVTGRMQGSSKLVLAWDGDNAVIVQN